MKYIIEIPDDECMINPARVEPSLCIPITIGDGKTYIYTDYRLIPYDESAAELRGAEKAWEFCRWLWRECDIDEVYGETMPLTDVLDMGYQDAVAKYEEWLKGKKEEDAKIMVGDEVIAVDATSLPFVVLCVNKSGIYGTDSCGNYRGCNYDESRFEKTGRHFPEVADLLKKIGGNE